jgi:outer membrane protein assembly factor BamB
VSDEKGLLGAWPEAGPRRLWSVTNVGAGFSSPIVAHGRLFITGDVGDDLKVFALELADGKKIWETANGSSWKGQYPGARASVTYSSGHLYHQNAHGRLTCLNAETGREVWSINVLERFGGANITWGLSECLVVDERAVYVTAGGTEALLVALDKRTGDVLWKSVPVRESAGDRLLENASYASPILIEFAGRRLLVGCSARQLFGVDADTGRIHWTRPMRTAYSVLAMMPVLVNGGIFMTAPHGTGGHFFRLRAPASPESAIDVTPVWQTRLDTCQGGVVHAGGKLFGSYYPGRKGWAALEARSGEILYEDSEMVKGAVLWADERLYVLSEDGWMQLLEPREREFLAKGRFRFGTGAGREVWAHPAIHDGRLYLRDGKTLACFEIKAN